MNPRRGSTRSRARRLTVSCSSLTKKLGITSVVVTHEMDSAFTIADRMAMLRFGKMLTVQDRAYFEKLKDASAAEIEAFDDQEKMIRQFLRGDADGPNQWKDSSGYAVDLLGESASTSRADEAGLE